MRTSHVLLCLCILAYGVPAHSQSFPKDFDKLLLPVIFNGQVPGAFGSLWVTQLSLTNVGDSGLPVVGYDPTPGGCSSFCVPPDPIPPHATIYPTYRGARAVIPGDFLWVGKSRATELGVTLRVQDISRQSQTWGTSIPVIAESRALTARVSLTDVPMRAEFRNLLRVYDFEPNIGHSFVVRVYAVQPSQQIPFTNTTADQLLVELVAAFATPDFNGSTIVARGYYELSLSALPQLANAERIRVEIEPISADLKYWAFVSVTNDATQHVTLITP